MYKVQPAQRNEYPYSTELDTIPLEILEMICHFLNAEDVAHLSGVNHSLNMSLSQRVVAIGTTDISKALSDGRADQAFSMLTSFCKWLGSAHVKFSLNEKLQVWKSLLDFAGHANLSEDQQSRAFRQIYFSACQTTDPVPDELLQLVQHIRAQWFCKFFPEGSVFIKANPCQSFKFLAHYLQGSQPLGKTGVDTAQTASPPKSVAWLGACIEAIRLHENSSDCSKQFKVIALKLSEDFEEIPQIYRATLVLDLTECIKQFIPKVALNLLPLIDPLIKAATEEEKTAYLKALHGVELRLHKSAAPDEDGCHVM
jgi:hypothetical protein